MDSIRQEKVQRFEEFVDHRLRLDLVRAIAERSTDGHQLSRVSKMYFGSVVRTKSSKNKNSDLRKNIKNLEKNIVTSLRTLVNITSEVYMQTDVLGFHVEFTWSEALNYITAREEKLASIMTGTQNAWVKIWVSTKLHAGKELIYRTI
ncbi:hypothetical protein HYC85_016888 [Camellia sinensis]|uniref:Uncharacterized protein n=1 Tax=Camellia sinensis TaxID=4442 RepID=A0A7J7H123_CAMSI|nr:hypothetical protein HYC85_016888 [Camellia sinensis]